MAPRGGSLCANWFRSPNGSNTSPSSGKQQLFHCSMLPLWLTTVLAQEDSCIAILCGAPCSGKTDATRRMAALYGDLLTVVSDDLDCDAQQQPSCNVQAHPDADFEIALKGLLDKLKVVLWDSGNTQFQDYAEQIACALSMGIKIHNIAWFVFDHGLPEAEEAEFLMSLQQKRLKNFWKNSEHPQTRSYFSDGKVTTLDVVRRSVRQVRKQYFHNQELKVFTAHVIMKELLEFSQSQHAHTSTPSTLAASPSTSTPSLPPSGSPDSGTPPDSTTTLYPVLSTSTPQSTPIAHTNTHTIPNGSSSVNQMPLLLPATLDSLLSALHSHHPTSTYPMSPMGATLPPSMALLSSAPSARLPTTTAHTPLMGTSSGVGGTAMHSNALPSIGSPPELNATLAGDQSAWDQQQAPMYFVLSDGHTGSQMMPLHLQFNSPSSAASPPFTAPNGATSHFSSSAAHPAAPFSFDESAPAHAFCLSHRPGQFADVAQEPTSGPYKNNGLQNGVLLGMIPGKRGRKNGYCNGVTNPYPNGATNGHGNCSSNGNGHSCNVNANKNNSNGNGNGHGSGTVNGHKSSSRNCKGRNSSSDGLKSRNGNGRRKMQNGWSANGHTPLMNGGLTLRSVLNEYWTSHKPEFDAAADLGLQVPAELLAKSSRMGLDDELMLRSLQALMDEGEECPAS